KQISAVLDSLLRCAHWIVAGTVIGGEKKKSEKARLRKGLNILVATPGRLADHLNHTEALNVSNVRWLVLDEGDRLVELGFEHDIQKIVSALNLRMRARKSTDALSEKLPAKRTTILCSATMKMDVQKLGEISLKDAAHIQGDPADSKADAAKREQDTFSAPSQLKQSYAIVPAKLRLVTLVSVLKRAFIRKGAVTKVIVFISCADSVDFHFAAFTRAEDEPEANPDADNTSEQEKAKPTVRQLPTTLAELPTQAPSPVISAPSNPITAFRLHGSLQQAIRTSTLQAFTKSTAPSVLFCTDVASRGLDLPSVDLVVEYDPAFSRDEHLHRIGRTARAGREGRAMLFLQPGEEEGYVDVLKSGRRDGGGGIKREHAEDLLRKGFAPPKQTSGVIQPTGGREWEDAATQWQLGVERWALAHP
ncbi:ATP-dependent RNA helicase dbp7, partial [Coniosporium uncinatum]